MTIHPIFILNTEHFFHGIKNPTVELKQGKRKVKKEEIEMLWVING